MTGAPILAVLGARLRGLRRDRAVAGIAWPKAAVRRLATAMLVERERWPLWAPVGLGAGVALYFSLPDEPPAFLGVALVGLTLAAMGAARRRAPWLLAALAAGLIAGGFAAAQLRTQRVAAPVLAEPIRPAHVTGRIVEAAVRGNGRRVVLENVSIARLPSAATPARVRVTLRGADPRLAPGDWIAVRGALYPPHQPAAPGAFDFARKAYFARIGAGGFAFGRAQRIAPPEDQPGGGWRAAVARLRHHVTGRIRAAGDGQAGAVAAALLTGERGAISGDVLAAMRDAGLAHLLAISGLHLGLVGGIVFFAVRALLALCAPLALRYPIKKWAALAALAGTLFYLLLSGATIPTQRAFLMGGVVIAAILLDRTAITMRSVALAAVAVLLIQPESLLGPSFQMSFAAVVAIIAVYERFRDRLPSRSTYGSWPRRVLVYLAAVAVVTLIASLATAPFAVYHFNRLAVYGLAANLLAVPATALWIMPWGVAALALMPLGLESWALAPMGWGIDWVIAVARTVAGWPGSVALLPVMPTAGLVLATLGGLWLCLWRQNWRWLGALAVVAGLATPALTRGPDVLVDGKGRLFAARSADGALALSSRAAARFAGRLWLRRNGQEIPAPWPGDDGRLRCDATGCIYRAKGWKVALVRDGRALAEDCRVADVVISVVPVRVPCASPRVVVDRFDLWREGGYAVSLDDGGVRVGSVAGGRGNRPWTRRRPGRDR